MTACTFRLSRSIPTVEPNWKCPHPAQENDGLCIWHDTSVIKRPEQVVAAVSEDLDLTGAQLSNIKLLEVPFLTGAELPGANLRNAKFDAANLWGSNLSGADLSFANLDYCNLSHTLLIGTNMTHAVLTECSFIATSFIHTDLTQAELGYSTFARCTIFQAKGLDSITHSGPSSISLDSIHAMDTVSTAFLRGIGFQENIIVELQQLLSESRYYSCFISYGEPDKSFAEALVESLRGKGISCWIYSLDSTPGARTQREIGLRRSKAEKFVIVCSHRALVRDGVLKELEAQEDEDPEKIIPVSFDDDWKHPGFNVVRSTRNLKPLLIDRNYADFSDPQQYDVELARLLKALEMK